MHQLEKHISDKAFSFLAELTKPHDFALQIKKGRKSKLGDFRAGRFHKPTITINADLDEQLFLFTFLHELAHFTVYKEHKNKVQPHGKEWKAHYQELLLLALRENLFSEPFLEFVLKYLAKPRATFDYPAYQKLMNLDEVQGPLLEELDVEQIFEFKGKRFQKIQKRRTRILCKRLDNNKLYTISGDAQIELLD